MKILQIVRPSDDETGGYVWTNDTGASVAANEVVYANIGTNKAHILVVGPQSIASLATGQVYRKGRYQFPAAASTAFTNAQTVQWASAAASVTSGGTASGLIAIGMAVAAVASAAAAVSTVVGVCVDINEGPDAFYQW